MTGWTEAEDAILREKYPKLRKTSTRKARWAEILKALPGRTKKSCHSRAQRLGIFMRPDWSDEEDSILRLHWADGSSRTLLADLPGRSWAAISRRAAALGLEGRWQGYVSICQAAKQFGFNFYDLLRILKENGVSLYRMVSTGAARPGVKRMVDPEDVAAVVERWLALETPKDAATRLGVPRGTILRWLKEIGITPRKRGAILRLESSVYDMIFEKKRADWEKRSVPRWHKERGHEEQVVRKAALGADRHAAVSAARPGLC